MSLDVSINYDINTLTLIFKMKNDNFGFRKRKADSVILITNGYDGEDEYTSD